MENNIRMETTGININTEVNQLPTTNPYIGFYPANDIFVAWRTLGQQLDLDDAQLAESLLRCYKESQRLELCTMCSGPLVPSCPKCPSQSTYGILDNSLNSSSAQQWSDCAPTDVTQKFVPLQLDANWEWVRDYQHLHCEFCEKTQETQDAFVWHLIDHSDRMPHVCSVCQARFFDQAVFHKHSKSHLVEKIFQCDSCGVKFISNTGLKKHIKHQSCDLVLQMRREKNGRPDSVITKLALARIPLKSRNQECKKPVVCELCLVPFATKCELERHALSHSGKKEFGCQTCGSSFAQACHLINHSRSHFNLAAFQCGGCKKAYCVAGAFNRHKCSKQSTSASIAKQPTKTSLSGNEGKPATEQQRKQKRTHLTSSQTSALSSSQCDQQALSRRSESNVQVRQTADKNKRGDFPEINKDNVQQTKNVEEDSEDSEKDRHEDDDEDAVDYSSNESARESDIPSSLISNAASSLQSGLCSHEQSVDFELKGHPAKFMQAENMTTFPEISLPPSSEITQNDLLDTVHTVAAFPKSLRDVTEATSAGKFSGATHIYTYPSETRAWDNFKDINTQRHIPDPFRGTSQVTATHVNNSIDVQQAAVGDASAWNTDPKAMPDLQPPLQREENVPVGIEHDNSNGSQTTIKFDDDVEADADEFTSNRPPASDAGNPKVVSAVGSPQAHHESHKPHEDADSDIFQNRSSRNTQSSRKSGRTLRTRSQYTLPQTSMTAANKRSIKLNSSSLKTKISARSSTSSSLSVHADCKSTSRQNKSRDEKKRKGSRNELQPENLKSVDGSNRDFVDNNSRYLKLRKIIETDKGNNNKTTKKTNNEAVFNRRPHKCSLCHARFAFPQLLNEHKVKKHNIQKQKYKCERCNSLFSKHRDWQRHINRNTCGKEFRCAECDKVFKSNDNLKHHQVTHSYERPFECDLCQKRFQTKERVLYHRQRHFEPTRYVCPECGKKFHFSSGYKMHLNTHLDKSLQPYKCQHCDRRFADPTGLTNHAVIHAESRDKNEICERCGMGFTTKKLLGKHRRVHQDKKPHACTLCPARFKYSDSLAVHVRTHTGEKPFPCQICGRAFSSKSNCRAHVKKCSEKNGVPYVGLGYVRNTVGNI